MSGPSRELPPLRVIVTGDSSGAVKAIQEVVDAARKARGKVKTITKDGVEEQVKDYKEMYRRMRQVDKAYARTRQAEDRASTDRLKQGIKDTLQVYRDGAKQLKQAEKELRQQGKLMPAFAREARKGVNRGPDLDALVASAEKEQKVREKINRNVQVSRDQAKKDYDKYLADIRKRNLEQEREEARVLRRSRERTIRRLRARRDQVQAATDSLRSGFDGGSMMGARADIYMHKDTLQSIGSMAISLIKPFAQVENYTIQMEAFAGSAEKAQKVVEELQRFAIASPYKLEGVLEASTTMMKYGANAEHALEMTKLLGDVAAGNTDKLRLMALAVGQAEALGRLQGQELRQMVNAGFNPLTIAAREMAGPGASDEAIKQQMQLMQEAMRAGRLDSNIIGAALKIATAKGGDFAGLTQKQAASLSGLASQIQETLDLAAIEIVRVFAADLKELMKTTKNYVDALIAWMKTNRDAVKEWTLFGLKVAEVVVTLSAAAMGLAWLKWVMGSMITLMRPLITGFILLNTSIKALTAGTAIGAMYAGFIAVAGAVAKVLGVALLLRGVLNGLIHENGFAGAFGDIATSIGNMIGYMWNIGHNAVNWFAFISKNWHQMILDMFAFLPKQLLNIVHLFAKMVGMGNSFKKAADNFIDFYYWLGGGKASGGYDTSMLKTMGPGMPTVSNILTKEDFAFLEKHLPKETVEAIKEKPNIDFNQFLGKGKASGSSFMSKGSLGEHATMGSSDHAMRMYTYGQSAMAEHYGLGRPQQSASEKYLSQIEQNTRPLREPKQTTFATAKFVTQ